MRILFEKANHELFFVFGNFTIGGNKAKDEGAARELCLIGEVVDFFIDGLNNARVGSAVGDLVELVRPVFGI